MRKKNEFTIMEQAVQTIAGFNQMCQKLKQHPIPGSRSQSTLDYYLRRIALVCLEFNRLPAAISEDEINEYLTGLAQMPKSPSRSSFKHAVYFFWSWYLPRQGNRYSSARLTEAKFN